MLNEIMEFNHVIRVMEDGTVQAAHNDVYGPESVWYYQTDTGEDIYWVDDDWSLLSGFTGQYGYNGPAMHPSEYVGGALEDFILSTPGYYVVLSDEDGDNWFVATKDAS